jgi:hypothetical protein
LLVWRHSRERLEGEIIRDALLATSGTLDEKMYGPGSLDEGQKRRSIYFAVKRSKMIPILTLFDGPDSLQSAGQRPSTTVAPQALWMMNNPHVQEYAKSLAEKLHPALEKSSDEAVRSAYRAVLGKSPDSGQQADMLTFFEAQSAAYEAGGKTKAAAQDAALANLCQALFAMNDFIFVE